MSNSNRSNQIMVPNAREAMNKFKMEAANEVGVNLKQGYNGDLTSVGSSSSLSPISSAPMALSAPTEPP